jgi:hypothetical protein
VHPASGKKMHFESELPADMLEGLDKWDGYASHQKNQ